MNTGALLQDLKQDTAHSQQKKIRQGGERSRRAVTGVSLYQACPATGTGFPHYSDPIKRSATAGTSGPCVACLEDVMSFPVPAPIGHAASPRYKEQDFEECGFVGNHLGGWRSQLPKGQAEGMSSQRQDAFNG